MKKWIAICLLASLLLVSLSAQAAAYFRYGTYIGVDDIDNDMFLRPYDEDGLYELEICLGDSGRDIYGTAVQSGSALTIKADFSGSQPRYIGTIETVGQNEYRVTLVDSRLNRREIFLFAWVAD